MAVAVDRAQNIFICDTGNHTIRYARKKGKKKEVAIGARTAGLETVRIAATSCGLTRPPCAGAQPRDILVMAY